jgi:hypothetical protein
MSTASIVSELLAFRKSELDAGRTPTEINLTDEQRKRLKGYCESTTTAVRAPDGRLLLSGHDFYSKGMIFGMRFSP